MSKLAFYSTVAAQCLANSYLKRGLLPPPLTDDRLCEALFMPLFIESMAFTSVPCW